MLDKRHLSQGLVAIAVLLAILIQLHPPAALSAGQTRTLGIVLVTLVLWATGVLPEYLSALIFFLAALLLEVATPAQIFSGFSSSAWWLIFAGMVIGMAIRSTGLGDRVAALLGRHLGHSYRGLVVGLVVVCTLLGFVMPSSMGRILMMVPVGLALAERCGFETGSRGRTGIALAVTFGCHVPTFTILPANIPNMVMVGAANTIYGVDFSYTDYLLLHFPILGALKALIIAGLILRFFPARMAVAPATPDHRDAIGRMTGQQRYLAVILLLALALWLTDSWHGVSPAWVGLGAAIYLLLPKVGLVDNRRVGQQLNITVLLFVAGVLGLGAVVNSSGLGQVLAATLEDWLPLAPGADARNFFSLVGMAFTTGILTTLPGVPAVLTPMAGQLSDLTGMNLEAVIMTQVVGFSTILLPYQSGPLLVGMQLANEPVRSLLRITVPLTVIALLILTPLDYLWWQLLGLFNTAG
ncbi:SLC13 family permease [Marinobacter halodurans]|uniref:SLC13 family permease n=1 Tax=Marinobacter halodurans TaxID=2528979 RepID=A0ABY1ZGI4_9GAMM|nr:SLC13 family permease [Marinobacter halodurans]TBW51259.1 SLC13 family permease [Marinobacter halodurans]